MLFSVIYSFDIPFTHSVARWAPPKGQRRKLWTLTECENERIEGDLYKHRKWCALLTRAEFEEFQSWCDLYMEDVETLGSLGAPGMGYGWSPAFNFNAEPDYNGWGNAYVTPIPGVDTREAFDTFEPKGSLDRHWDLLKNVMLRAYGT